MLGDDGWRINCRTPAGFYENGGAVKAATSADTADLVSNNVDELRVLCRPPSYYCTSIVFSPTRFNDLFAYKLFFFN